MHAVIGFLKGSIGRKSVIALTGLGLALFTLIHMLGNLLFFRGKASFNSYAHSLHEFVLIEILELGLLVFFLGHFLLAGLVTWQNKQKAGQYKKAAQVKSSSFVQKTLLLQAFALLIFIVWHLLTFKFGPHYSFLHEGTNLRDVHLLVEEVFQNLWYVIGYSLALFFLFFHTGRGVSASFRSLGSYSLKYRGFVEILSWSFSLIVFLGFLSIPLYVYFVL